MALAAGALALTAWRAIVPAGSACQTTAWDTTPKTEDLPSGWSISATQYDVDRKQMTVVGEVPADESSQQAVVYATVTCFASGAEDSVTRSADAAKAAGQTVTERDDLGDQAFSAADESGPTFIQLRHGDVVVYLASSGVADEGQVDTVASAFDKALGGDGGQQPVGTPDVVPSVSASDESAIPPPSRPTRPRHPRAPPRRRCRSIPATVGDVP